MRVWRRIAFALGVTSLASVSAVARAAPSSPVIWFRSSEGCPDGAAFVARLRGPAAGARLAEVTDRIDFVVTLGSSGSRSTGRLERQTASSTVAIREIEAESCEAVADVLALTLTLALDPAAAPVDESAAPPPVATGAVVAAPKAETVPTPPVAAAVATPREDGGEATKTPSSRPSEPVWLLGGDVGPFTGPSGALGVWAGLFLELRPGLSALPRMSTRLTALYSRSEDEATELVFTTAGGRLEGCPVALGGDSLELRPCLALELGLATAESLSSFGRTDTGAWFAASGFARVGWRPARGLVLSLDAGAYAPLIRYSFVSELSTSAQHADSIGFFAAVGAALVLL